MSTGEISGLGKVNQPLIDVDNVLAAFGDTVRTARRAYVRALKGARQDEWRGEVAARFQWWSHEVDRPLEPVAPAAWVDELGRSTGLERPRMDSAEFKEAYEKLDEILATHSKEKKRFSGKDR